jgi:acetyl esterase/lipase
MRRSIRWILMTLLLPWPGAVFAQQPQPGDPAFDRSDNNRDGKLSREELPEPLRNRFGEFDSDKDGFLSREENRAMVRRMGPGQAGPGGPGAQFQPPESVRIEQDVPYAGTKNPRQTLDLLLPKVPESDKPLPVIVFIHGGAFRAGHKSSGLPQIANFVAGGEYAGATINYRLSGEAIWPAQIHDCKAAIRWVRANAAKYHFDPDRIGVIGSSAGGHLVAMLGASGGLQAMEGDLGPYTGTSSKVTCVVDQFGPSELLTMSDYPSRIDHNAADSPESRLIGGAVQENKEAAQAASPITYVSRDDPPFLIIHGEADPLVPFNQSERFEKALKAAGVETFFIRVKEGGHGGFRNPELSRRTRQFLDKHLRGQPVGTISEEPVANAPAQPKE